MKFDILDTQGVYRRLLDAPDAAAREAIVQTELIPPFEGLARFFGMDGLSAFRMWQMPPELFADRERIAAMLDAMTAFDVWRKAEKALHDGWRAFEPYADRLDLRGESITFSLMITQSAGQPRQGYAGFGAIPPWIMTTIGDANDYTLPRIATATAHELHHNLSATVRGRTPMIASLADYIVGEGLAESFGASLYGEETIGYYVTDFDESRWDETVRIIGEHLDETDFNKVRGYVFGEMWGGQLGIERATVPTYAGYALGYRAVQAYLARTGQSVAEATFVPAREILDASGLFA
ncbi:MAG: hypothetical protein IPK19_27655 [Chloroflexi bacterium]|nr:hypothetical protein [Chloroflexota bacterium]